MKESVKSVLELLDGLKTYITCAVILVLLMLHWAGKLVLPPEFYAGLAVLALAFLRAGVAKSAPVVLACAGLLMVGCATPIADATLDRIEQVASSAASAGVAADLVANKNHRPVILELQQQLEAQIATGRVTSGQLAAIIVDKLPLDAKSAQYFEGGLVLWGITSAWWIAPNAEDASMRAAVGLVTGIKLGLAAAPARSLRASVVMPPKPGTDNVRKL